MIEGLPVRWVLVEYRIRSHFDRIELIRSKVYLIERYLRA